MIEIHDALNPETATYAAADYVNQALRRHQNSPVLLMLSGGSSLKVPSLIDLRLCDDVTVAQVDERITPKVEDRNSTGLANIEFVKPAGLKFVPVEQGLTLQESAARYERELRSWVKVHPGAFIFAVLGMGSDGHIAGMMPGFEKLFNGKKWVVGYDAGNTNTFRSRVTVTNTFLRDIVDDAVLFVTGEEKRNALNTIRMHPAGVIYEMDKAVLFTDIRDLKMN
jgi:6-phosphogluconolactonase/glucosamine-6-phosphate isomerase/deaminase